VKRSRKNDWRALLAAVKARDTVSSSEIARMAKQHTGISTDYALRYLKRKGVIRPLDNAPRGLYAIIGGSADATVGDPIKTVQAAEGATVVFAYGTALLVHGLSRYGRLAEYYVASVNKRKPKRMGTIMLRFVKIPAQEEMGVTDVRRAQGSVRLTDLERTLIDCVHRPKYAQGWENVVHALRRARGVKASRMIEYVKHYRTPSLVAKIGWIIEQECKRWKATNGDLLSLRAYLPRSPVNFFRGGGGALNRTWRLYVPKGVLNE
jgi:predicted transcriptional regulator of viral defense system